MFHFFKRNNAQQTINNNFENINKPKMISNEMKNKFNIETALLNINRAFGFIFYTSYIETAANNLGCKNDDVKKLLDNLKNFDYLILTELSTDARSFIWKEVYTFFFENGLDLIKSNYQIFDDAPVEPTTVTEQDAPGYNDNSDIRIELEKQTIFSTNKSRFWLVTIIDGQREYFPISNDYKEAISIFKDAKEMIDQKKMPVAWTTLESYPIKPFEDIDFLNFSTDSKPLYIQKGTPIEGNDELEIIQIQ